MERIKEEQLEEYFDDMPTSKLPSFQTFFSKYKGGFFFIDDRKGNVLSLHMDIRELSNEEKENWNVDHRIYEISNIGWQDESDYFHNVCGTSCSSGRPDGASTIAIYDHCDDLLLQDAYLGDKYGDGADGWFSEHILGSFFEKKPRVRNQL